MALKIESMTTGIRTKLKDRRGKRIEKNEKIDIVFM